MRPFVAFSVLGLTLTTLFADSPPDPFKGVRDAVRPADTDDRWATIPWRISLWEARREAAKAGKPILLWEMDGHPLGCT